MNKNVLVLCVFLWIATFSISFLFSTSFLNRSTKVLSTKTANNEPFIKMPERIAYVSDKSGNYEIYLIDPNLEAEKNLTNSPGNDMNPMPSSDGKYIVFYSDRDGDNEIYKLNIESLELTKITSNESGDYDPSFSPDGGLIAYKSNKEDGLGDIFVIDSSGKSAPTNLTRQMQRTEEWDPSFYPSGDKIVFVSRGNELHASDELYSINVDGSGLQQITKNTVPDWYPTILPDNNSILAVSKNNPYSDDEIFVINSETRKKIFDLAGNSNDPYLSADGKKTIFINDSGGNYDMYFGDLQTGSVSKYLETKYAELSPIILP